MMRARLGVLAILCAFTALPRGPHTTPTPAASAAAPAPSHQAVLEMQDSYDDALLACGTFTGDGRDGDPEGVDAFVLWRDSVGEDLALQILHGRPPGQGTEDWKGHWIHYRRIDGRLIESHKGLLEYRIHDREQDYWGFKLDGEEFSFGPTDIPRFGMSPC